MIFQKKLKADVKISVNLDMDEADEETMALLILEFEQFLNSLNQIEVEVEKEKIRVYPRFHLWDA